MSERLQMSLIQTKLGPVKMSPCNTVCRSTKLKQTLRDPAIDGAADGITDVSHQINNETSQGSVSMVPARTWLN